jgi:hypothetical protein
MSVTRTEFREALRDVLVDRSQWRDSQLNTWIDDGIRDYSRHFPLSGSAQFTCSAGVRSYSLAAYAPLAVTQVEYPCSQTPRRLLLRRARSHPAFIGCPVYDLSADLATLYLGETPAGGEILGVEVHTLHSLPASDASSLSLPDHHLELLRLYVVWQARLMLELDESASVTRSPNTLHALSQAVSQAERQYQSCLLEAQRSQLITRVSGSWGQDEWGRIY